MSSSLAELQSLIAQAYDEIRQQRRDHQDLQVALVSPQKALKSSSCLAVEFHHHGTKYEILFSNGTTALVQVKNARKDSQKLLAISHSCDAVEIYSDLSSQLEVIESLEETHDLRRLLYFIFIIYFQKNRLPYSQEEAENQVVPMKPQGRTRPKALSVEKRLCLPYEVRRKLTFEKKLALCDKPEWAAAPVFGAELERRLVVPFLDSSKKEILITKREIAQDFLQNLILQKLQKRIPHLNNQVKLAESAHGPIPLPSQESFEAPKPVLKMKPRERITPVAEKLKNHIEKLEKPRLKAPLKKNCVRKSEHLMVSSLTFEKYFRIILSQCIKKINSAIRAKKSQHLSCSLVPSLSVERYFRRILSESIEKINSAICARALNLLKIWAEPVLKASVWIPHTEAPKTSLVVVPTLRSTKTFKFAPGLVISSILKAHFVNYQQIRAGKNIPITIELKPRRQLALSYQKTLALPFEKILALPYMKILALTYPKVYALPYAEPEAIPLPNKQTVIALPNKPVLAIAYQPRLALPYTKVLALPYEESAIQEIPDIYKFLEPKWLDYLGVNTRPVGTLKLYTDSSSQEHTTSVDLSFSSSDESENSLEDDDDDEISLQESFIEEANQEHLPLLEAQSTSELSEIDLDLQVSTQTLEKPEEEEEDVYGFEVIPDDDIVIIEEDVVCVNETGY